ncbi:hypothetical protein [Streptomyces sp. F001]|nr:hypothetical protein [Streptomyces sp. F001]
MARVEDATDHTPDSELTHLTVVLKDAPDSQAARTRSTTSAKP